MAGRLQRAIERFDLRAYVEEHFDDVREAAGGEELRVCCFAPNGCAGVDDSSHKLYINPDKKQWICFKCGYGKSDSQPGTGSLIRFMADVEGKHPVQIRYRLMDTVEPTPSEEFADVLRDCFAPEEAKLEPKITTIRLPKHFRSLYEDTFKGIGKVALPYHNYAKQRGLTDSWCRLFDVRYSFSMASAFWRNRLIFPVYDLAGRPRSAVGRALPAKKIEVREPWANWPKTDIRELLWPLGGFNRIGGGWSIYNKDQFDHAVLTEGIFDALAAISVLAGSSIKVYCTFGKKISDGQIDLLQELGFDAVTLAWDKDAKKEIQSAAQKLSNHFSEVLVFPFNSPLWQGHDLGDAIKNSGEVPPHLIVQELGEAVDVQSSEFITWMMK